MRAIELYPDYALAYYNLGTTLMGEERYKESEYCYRNRPRFLLFLLMLRFQVVAVVCGFKGEERGEGRGFWIWSRVAGRGSRVAGQVEG